MKIHKVAVYGMYIIRFMTYYHLFLDPWTLGVGDASCELNLNLNVIIIIIIIVIATTIKSTSLDWVYCVQYTLELDCA